MSDFFKQSLRLGNASDYPYVAPAGSHVYSWKPHEVVEIFPQLDYPRDEFGRPRRPSEENQARDAAGNLIPSADAKVVKKGADLQGIYNHLMSKDGCPLFMVNGDESDLEREKVAAERFHKHKFAECTQIKESWMRKVKAALDAGGTPPYMPEVEYEADQFLARFGRLTDNRMKRFLVLKDGASFDYEEEAKVHLLHPTRNPEVASEWQRWIKDTMPMLPKPKKFSAVAEAAEPVGYNATTLGLIAEATEAGIEIEKELLDRVDSGDRQAMREVLERLVQDDDEPDKAKKAPPTEGLKPWQLAQVARRQKAEAKAKEAARA